MIRPALGAAMSLAILTGCAVKPATTLSQFNPADAAYILEDGNNTIRGQAFLRQRGGGTVTCAGNDVALIPSKGEYAQERFRKLFGTTQTSAVNSNVQIDAPDPRYVELSRHTRCRADGSFEFTDVPNGPYFVITFVVWHVGQYNQQGGAVMAPVWISGGEVVELIIP